MIYFEEASELFSGNFHQLAVGFRFRFRRAHLVEDARLFTEKRTSIAVRKVSVSVDEYRTADDVVRIVGALVLCVDDRARDIVFDVVVVHNRRRRDKEYAFYDRIEFCVVAVGQKI